LMKYTPLELYPSLRIVPARIRKFRHIEPNIVGGEYAEETVFRTSDHQGSQAG
jgi:hypothetical protein